MLFGFTLAEVLIVLGIIGLIADMTIPTLHQSIEEKVTVSRLKKAYSSIDQAFKLAVLEDGDVRDWLTSDDIGTNSITIIDKLSKKMNILKKYGQEGGCVNNSYKRLNGSQQVDPFSTEWASLKLTDGTAIALWSSRQIGTGHVVVDINGDKKPNQYGVDLFWFVFVNDSVTPQGAQKAASDQTFDVTCQDKPSSAVYSGRGCTAWVIYNENLDYLHCNTLSWDGAKSCKQ